MLSDLTFQFDLNWLTLTASCQTKCINSSSETISPWTSEYIWHKLAVAACEFSMGSCGQKARLELGKKCIFEAVTSKRMYYPFV